MKGKHTIEGLIRTSRYEASSEAYERGRERFLGDVDNYRFRKAELSESNTSRAFIMKTTKRVAAVVAVFAVLVGLWPEAGMSSKVYGMGDVPAVLRQTKTLHTKGMIWIYDTKEGRGGVAKATMVPREKWLDFPNLKERFVSYNAMEYTGAATKQVGATEGLRKGELAIDIDHATKKVRYNRVSLIKRQLELKRAASTLHLQRFIDDIRENDSGFVKTGSESIDGVLFDIWILEREDTDGKLYKHKCWLDPTTGQLGRYYGWEAHGENWRPLYFLEKIEQDIIIPDAVFEFDAPEDYTYLNTEETAYSGEGLGAGWYMMHEARVCLAINFTLDDGSVIVAWHSDDLNQDRYQEQKHLFENLEPGGELPRLPMVIYGLKTAFVTSDSQAEVMYSGHHLGFTKQAGWYYEWAIYVPEEESPSTGGYRAYRTLCRFNLPEDRVSQTGNSIPEYRIDPDEFDTFVRGAMAELSDDGVAPDYVTYDNVMQLAQEIRRSRQSE